MTLVLQRREFSAIHGMTPCSPSQGTFVSRQWTAGPYARKCKLCPSVSLCLTQARDTDGARSTFQVGFCHLHLDNLLNCDYREAESVFRTEMNDTVESDDSFQCQVCTLRRRSRVGPCVWETYRRHITLSKRPVRPNSVPACSLTQARGRKVGGAGVAGSIFSGPFAIFVHQRQLTQ